MGTESLWQMVKAGGFAMYPLVICSLLVWVVVFERLWRYRRLGQDLRFFHMEAINAILRSDARGLKSLCARYSGLPSSELLVTAVERLSAADQRIRQKWPEAVERRRQIINQDLRRNFWILGTIGSSAPFIGLFGTVVGILQSFQQMAKTGSGGFAVVASGISESLIATASGIIVAVISVIAYNAFQTRWNGLVLTIKLQAEEFSEMLGHSEQMFKPENQGRESRDGN
jgi:biopolymer transport protein ExbB